MAGKAFFTSRQIKHKNYHILYAQVLGIMELLQPFIFHSNYSSSLEGIILGYFDLFQQHLDEIKTPLISLLKKFTRFLDVYHSYRPASIRKILKKYQEFLNSLSNDYPEIPDIQTLLSTLTRPLGETESGRNVLLRSDSPVGLTTAQQNLVNTINQSSATLDLLEVLKDVDNISKSSADLLVPIRVRLSCTIYLKFNTVINFFSG